MKEYTSDTGGRYTYVDDILNLQELALAFGKIFEGCDNFIVSGCEVSGNSISPGYVYLNGKFRRFSGASSLNGTWPQYIYEHNTTESVPYAGGSEKIGRNVWDCSIGSTVPTTLTTLTNAVPQFITITQEGGKTIKEAFFGRYALLIGGSSQTEGVDSKVLFNEGFIANGDSTITADLKFEYGAQKTVIRQNPTTFQIITTINGAVYKYEVEEGVGHKFFINGHTLFTISQSEITFENPACFSYGAKVGSIQIENSNIYQRSSVANDACVNINMCGYDGGTSYFRDTRIGDGKGRSILFVDGSESSISISGRVSMYGSDKEGLVLRSSVAKSSTSLVKEIVWKDDNGDVIGEIGYTSTTDNKLRIKNHLTSLEIEGVEFVDIKPTIKENGVALSEKYVTIAFLAEYSEARDSVLSTLYCLKTEANNKFASKTGGLSQFVTGSNDAAALRSQIGAMSSSTQVAILSNCLSDMATDSDKKQAIRNNIGAADASTTQAKLKDTGWLNVTKNSGIESQSLKAKQFGKVVSIQGTTKLQHRGGLFTLPDQIDPPTYKACTCITENAGQCFVVIDANSRVATITYCAANFGTDQELPFTLTYMV